MTMVEAVALCNVLHDINHVANELAKETVSHGRKKSYAARVKEQKKAADTIRRAFHSSFNLYSERMKHGIALLKAAGVLRNIDTAKIASFISRVRDPNLSLASIQDEFGISDEDMVLFHECGSQFFERQEFENAADVFLVLTFFNALVPIFWASLGMAESKREDFEAAGLSYLMAAEIDEENLTWALSAAECYLKAGNAEIGHRILDIIIEAAGNDPKYAQVKASAHSQKLRR
jgi:hypothetical protein